MNCQVVQRRLMGLPNPDQAPTELAAHLAACASCREWQSQLVQFERHIPFLPVPPSKGKARLLRQFVSRRIEEPVRDNPFATLAEASDQTIRQVPSAKRGRHAMTAAVLAAALALVVLTGWALQGRFSGPPVARPGMPDPLLANLLERDLRLASATTPRQRIEILADLAEDLREGTQKMAPAATQEELKVLASLYEEVVRNGIVRQAQALATADRERILEPIAERLDQTAAQVDRLTREVSAERAEQLQAIITSAHAGKRELRALLLKERA